LSSHLNTVCKPAATPGISLISAWNRGVGFISYTPNPDSPLCPYFRPSGVCCPRGFLSASGGSGVASAIAANAGAIGYVDSATQLARSLPAAVLRNKAGNYIRATWHY